MTREPPFNYTVRMDEKTDLILASGSPRRAELLTQAGIAFRVIVSDADEIAASDMPPAEVAMRNARAKARAVAADLDHGAIVIGADTIVVLDGAIFGKPKDPEDATRMLHELSGRTHQVITGVCIAKAAADRQGLSTQVLSDQTFAEITDVTFRNLAAEEIATYVATGEPLDKAGAYGIQGKGGKLVDHIDGDYDNVVGLPVARLQRALDLERGNKIDNRQSGEQKRVK